MVGRSAVLERLWKGRCDVVVRENRKDPDTRRMESTETALASELPCRLSFETLAPAGDNANAVQLAQEVKLFLGREVRVPEGSKLVVTQNGVTTAYRQSGPPAVYAHHQEIRLELFRRWA